MYANIISCRKFRPYRSDAVIIQANEIASCHALVGGILGPYLGDPMKIIQVFINAGRPDSEIGKPEVHQSFESFIEAHGGIKLENSVLDNQEKVA